jgi:hypothetical protein
MSWTLIVSASFTLMTAMSSKHSVDISVPKFNFLKKVSDTSIPIKVLSDDKMNIMVDYQKEVIAIQWKGINKEDRPIVLTDNKGKVFQQQTLNMGSTLVFFETQTLYSGDYILKIFDQQYWIQKKITLFKPD